MAERSWEKTEFQLRQGEQQLHIAAFLPPAPRAVALCVHGSLATGRSFYSHGGRGLAPYLASQGIACYVPDLRGRGRSRPAVGADTRHGQWEIVVEDIPALHAFVRRRHPAIPLHWLAHSWGGVMMAATLARQPALCSEVASLCFVACKRSISVRNRHYFLQVGLVWLVVARLVAAVVGYLPARRLRIGAGDESRLSLLETYPWIRVGPWRDPRDGFDYGEALARIRLPRAWLLAAAADPVLGHPRDVQRFAAELSPAARCSLIGRDTGYSRDYSHIGILTEPSAETELFPRVRDWLLAPGSGEFVGV